MKQQEEITTENFILYPSMPRENEPHLIIIPSRHLLIERRCRKRRWERSNLRYACKKEEKEEGGKE